MRIVFRPRFVSCIAGAFAMCCAVLIAACGAASPPAVAGGAKQTPPVSSATPNSKPAGKISPDMVGKLSPIAAFVGQGEGWRIDIRALDARQHHVALHWTKPARTDSGTALYSGALDAPRSSPLALDGRLRTATGTQSLNIEIRRQDCTDDQGTRRPQTIVLTLAGGRRLEGCGDLALY